MATQSTILAAGQTEATSADVTVEANTSTTVGIFATGEIPPNVRLSLRVDTPGTDGFVMHLTAKYHVTQVNGPAVYRIYRPDITADGVDVGAYKVV